MSVVWGKMQPASEEISGRLTDLLFCRSGHCGYLQFVHGSFSCRIPFGLSYVSPESTFCGLLSGLTDSITVLEVSTIGLLSVSTHVKAQTIT